MKNEDYKRLARIEAAADAQRAELMSTLRDAYERACQEHNEEDAAALARKIRDKLLEESDNRLTLDRLGLTVPTGKTCAAWLSFLIGLGDVLTGAWARYRAALRDLPEQEGFPFNITFPSSPEEEAENDDA